MERQESSRAGAERGTFTKPQGPPPADQKKERQNSVYASGDGKIFEIPLDVAQKYEVKGGRADELRCLVPQAGEQGDEVGGRHATTLVGGGYGYHSNWLYGSYIWWRDGNVYRGNHWHPYVNNPLAYDIDDL